MQGGRSDQGKTDSALQMASRQIAPKSARINRRGRKRGLSGFNGERQFDVSDFLFETGADSEVMKKGAIILVRSKSPS